MSEKSCPTDAKHGRLNYLGEAPYHVARNGRLVRYTRWQCDCGNAIVANHSNVMVGHTNSCGCFKMDKNSLVHRTHGHTRGKNPTRAYRYWTGMIDRCENPNAKNFQEWGGRGITICEWLRRFETFLYVLGERPPALEIDRWPNNSTGNYTCGQCPECRQKSWSLNVRWATKTQQNQNKRNNLMFTVNGVTACLKELCRHFHINYGTVRTRLEKGWPIEDALARPLLK